MTRTRLWFPLVAPPLAFGAEGAFGWWIGDRICTSLSIGSVRAIAGGVSVAMVVLAVAATVMGLGSYRAVSGHTDVAGDRVEFMALGGVLVSIVFLIGLIWFALNPLFIRGCGGMR
jgi:hypothetical protein